MLATSPSPKSYQLVKIVSGGSASGKSLILTYPQLLEMERFYCVGAVRLEQFDFCIALIF